MSDPVELLTGRLTLAPGAELPAWTCRRTKEPPGPRMSCTTSSSRQPTTSTISPLLPWPTERMRSVALSAPVCWAEPPGRISMTVT